MGVNGILCYLCARLFNHAIRNTNRIDNRRAQRQQRSLDEGFARNLNVLLTLRREVMAVHGIFGSNTISGLKPPARRESASRETSVSGFLRFCCSEIFSTGQDLILFAVKYASASMSLHGCAARLSIHDRLSHALQRDRSSGRFHWRKGR